MTCPVGLLRGSAVARVVDRVHPDAHSESMRGWILPPPGPPCPLKDGATFSSRPLADQKFSLAPWAPTNLDKKLSPGPSATSKNSARLGRGWD